MVTSLEPPAVGKHRVDRLLLYMAATYFLTAVGVMMLGPLLPLLSRTWGLADGAGGALLSAQFLGSYCGAVLLRRQLRMSLVTGGLCCVVGHGAMAVATHFAAGFPFGVAALLAGGFGLGQLINSISMIAGRRYREGRGRVLMGLNLIWSLGALLGPVYVGFAAIHLPLSLILTSFVAAAAALLFWERSMKAEVWAYSPEGATPVNASAHSDRMQRTWQLAAYFTLLFFLYGAFENSISGWVSTFALRYAHTTEAAAALSTTVLWAGITAGRAVGLLLLRFCSERQVQLCSVFVAVVTSGLLFGVDGPVKMFVLTTFIGCGLAPFIPVTVSLFLAKTQPSPRLGGFVLATNALGGACLPWVVGMLSQRYHSLKFALELPTMVGALLVLLCLLPLSRASGFLGSLPRRAAARST